MQAIVLTFDRYKVFSDHMIQAYEKLWPDNPFIFRIPYQDQKIRSEYEKKYGNKVKLIESSSNLIKTVKTLLADFNDDDWIYWCMDDRYPISLESQRLNLLYKWIKTIDDTDISAIMFLNSRKGQLPQNLYYNKNQVRDPQNNKYRRRKNYTMIWMHQFMRAKVMKSLFNNFPEDLAPAKEMDYIMFKLQLPENQQLYVLNKNLGVFGESTSRGKLTQNCLASFKQNNIPIPENFEISNKTIVIGSPTTLIDDIVFWVKTIVKLIIGKFRKL